MARNPRFAEAAEEAPAEVVAVVAEPVVEVSAPKFPRFSAEGVLLNPDECEVGADGVVGGKA